jgi:hypothetical protein
MLCIGHFLYFCIQEKLKDNLDFVRRNTNSSVTIRTKLWAVGSGNHGSKPGNILYLHHNIQAGDNPASRTMCTVLFFQPEVILEGCKPD